MPFFSKTNRKLDKRILAVEADLKALKKRVKLLEAATSASSETTDENDTTRLLNLVQHMGNQDDQEVIKKLAMEVFTKEEQTTCSRTGKKTIKSGDAAKPALDKKKLEKLEQAARTKCPNLTKDLFNKKIDNIIKMERRQLKNANKF